MSIPSSARRSTPEPGLPLFLPAPIVNMPISSGKYHPSGKRGSVHGAMAHIRVPIPWGRKQDNVLALHRWMKGGWPVSTALRMDGARIRFPHAIGSAGRFGRRVIPLKPRDALPAGLGASDGEGVSGSDSERALQYA